MKLSRSKHIAAVKLADFSVFRFRPRWMVPKSPRGDSPSPSPRGINYSPRGFNYSPREFESVDSDNYTMDVLSYGHILQEAVNASGMVYNGNEDLLIMVLLPGHTLDSLPPYLAELIRDCTRDSHVSKRGQLSFKMIAERLKLIHENTALDPRAESVRLLVKQYELAID